MKMWMTSKRIILAFAVGIARGPFCNSFAYAPSRALHSSMKIMPYQMPKSSMVTTRRNNKASSHLSPLFASDSISSSNEKGDKEPDETVAKKKSLLGKAMDLIKPKSSENLSTKEMLKKMGLSVLLSYGFVSNMTYCIMTGLSWFTFSKKTGMSPLAPGQWKGFLAVYAGFYVFANVIRPFRVGLSVAISKYFDNALNYIQKKGNVSKGVAIGILMSIANVLVTTSVMILGIILASLLSGVPIFPAKA